MKALLIGIVLFFAALMLAWRLISKYRSLPCPSWLGWMVKIDNPLANQGKAKNIIKHLNLQEGMTVADVGCGPGRLTIPLAQAVGPTGIVLAMDVQGAMLEKVKERSNGLGLKNIEFLEAGIGENKLEENKYDRVLLVFVLGEVPNQITALKEVFKALKPGGILSITETFFDPHFQSSKKVRQLALEIGFAQKQIFDGWFDYTIHFVANKT